MSVYGMAYPITSNPLGLLRSVKDLKVLESDLLVLLLTEPGERVMLPEFGTPLNQFLFNPNDGIEFDEIRTVISQSIATWERRIAVDEIYVGHWIDPNTGQEDFNTLSISIKYKEYGNILNIQELNLTLPMS